MLYGGFCALDFDIWTVLFASLRLQSLPGMMRPDISRPRADLV